MADPHIGVIFHGIGSPARTLEPGEAPYWISKDHFASVLDMICALPDPSEIRISFDDGNLSDLEIGLPLLLERGLQADFFVLTGRIGKPGSLDIADILALQAAGMTIGSHGIQHLKWSTLAAASLAAEVTESRQTLEHLCAKPVLSAAIPFGAYNAGVLRALRQAGYTSVYSSDGGTQTAHAFLRPRSSVVAGMTPLQTADILAAKIGLKRRIRRKIGILRKHLF
jgi:peptidoglycan/xylan/chitin deacetylase (PgdA/CDA1 family)